MAAQDPRARELMEKHRRRELTPAEERELARRSLNDDELFNELAVDGLIEEQLENEEFKRRWLDEPLARLRAARKRRRIPVWAFAGAACLAGALAVVFLLPKPAEQAAEGPVDAPTRLPVTAALPDRAAPGQPVLLASRLTPPEPPASTAFRGAAGSEARNAGVVTVVNDDGITVALGYKDGVSERSVLRATRAGSFVAELRVAEVSRDISRVEVIRGGPVQVGDRVALDAASRIEALWAKAETLASKGDHAGAKREAQAALDVAKGAPSLLWQAEERLADAEFRAGATEAARKRLKDVVGANPASQSAWESLGAIELLNGSVSDARAALEQALRLAQKASDSAAQVRALNNLAALAAVEGDGAKEQSLLRQARDLAATGARLSARERLALQQNVSRALR
jgi:tetratricopeptide (TPR) repeat protein